MFGFLIDHFTIFAQGEAPGGDPFPMHMVFLFIGVILVVMWLLGSPRRKEAEQYQKMMDALERNDRVQTVGGIIGTVHQIDKDKNEVVIKVDESSGTKIRFSLHAISMVYPKDKSEK